MIKLPPVRLLLVTLIALTFTLTARPAQSAVVTQGQPTADTTDQLATPPTIAWEAATLPAGITPAQVINLVVEPGNANVAYLATHKGLHKTADAGQSWQRVGGDGLDYIFGVALSGANSQRIYAQTWNLTLYRSDDGGANWSKFALPADACNIVAAPSDANRLYARRCHKDNQALVYRSLDGGQSWATPNNKLDQTIDALAVAPNDPAILIASTFDKSYRSSDSGETWTKLTIGTRYFGRPLFDPAVPNTVYLGHHTGVLRSTDAGVTWLDSSADREFATMLMGTDSNNSLVGGNKSATWRLTMDAKGWSATDWETPQALVALWRSSGDSQVIYALNEVGFWRQRQVAAAQPFTPAAWVYLPVVQNGEQNGVVRQQAETIAAATTTADAIARANEYRQQVGLAPLQSHAAIGTAAQNHANYYVTNAHDPAAQTYGPHGEVAGKPQFTGQWPSDRLKAANYPWFGGAEIIHFRGDAITSVDGWMATVYHRFPLLDPGAHYAGYAQARKDNSVIDVMDFGGGPTATGVWLPANPYPLAYPANGQTEVPVSWDGGEVPNPLPPGTPGPVGYPFTLQPIGGKLKVDRAELRTAAGAVVAVHPNPADCASGSCYTLIAVSPLQPRTEYIVDAAGNVDGVPFQQQWRFTTGDSSVVAATAPPEQVAFSQP